MDETYDDKVKAGVMLLDGYFGKQDWRSEIDIDRLQMDEVNLCVIGQLFGDYYRGLEKLSDKVGYLTLQQRRNLGFSAEPFDSQTWSRLEWAWKRYLGSTND